jgi:hypothetical protein
MGHLGEAIDSNEHRVLATNEGKINDETSGEKRPRLFGDWGRLKEATWAMVSCFEASTSVARLDEFFGQFLWLCPPIPSREQTVMDRYRKAEPS